MFKFKFIKETRQKNNTLNLITPLFPCAKEPEDFFENQFSLVLMNEKEQKVGSACLTQKNLDSLQEDIRSLLPADPHTCSYVWECSSIYPVQSKLLPFQENLPCYFYHCLYEGLVAFGKHKRIGFMVVKLTADAYLPTKKFGLWPYVVQLLPAKSPDNLFYGILPLKGCFYESYKKQLKAG